MINKIFLMIFSLLSPEGSLVTFPYSLLATFTSKEIGPYHLRISSIVNNQEVGFIYFLQIPAISFYILHTFYIYPPYRNTGYGRELLSSLSIYLKAQGAKKIYIQPGPFEMPEYIQTYNTVASSADNTLENRQIYENKVHALIKFYQSVGFTFVNPLIAKCLRWIYKAIGISENPQYLMVLQ